MAPGNACEDAKKACELTEWKVWQNIEDLIFVSTAVGERDEAIKWQRKLLEDPTYAKVFGSEARKRLRELGVDVRTQGKN
ncbi:MAG TPA: hypothetical protein VLM40_17885 [Gemmata sp.]|nr:hypothetical protein [Gemmata sp.]